MAKQTFTTGQVLTAAQMTSLQETALGGGPATAKTASYVLVAADAGTTVAMNAAGATTITVNTGLFAAGDTVFIQNLGAGACTITAGTATVATAGSLILPQNDAGILYFTTASASIFYDYVQPGITSPVTTKGDLYSFTTTDARLPVGNDGESIVADSSTSTGLAYREDYAAGKNKIINGDFTINQRGFTSTSTGNNYGFDRFYAAQVDGTTSYSAQTFTPGTAPVAGYEAINFARVSSSGQTATNASLAFRQGIENVRTLAGQTATISFWAKANSGAPKVAIELIQAFGSGGSPSTAVLNYVNQVTLSTSWARYSVTFSVPSISGKTIGTDANSSQLVLVLWCSAGTDFNARTGSLGIQSNDFDFWGVQVEEGSVATAFNTATGTLAGELAACQRYFRQITSATGIGQSTTAIQCSLSHLGMRTTPTAAVSAAVQITDVTTANFTQSSSNITINENNSEGGRYQLANFTGLTANRPYIVVTSSGKIQLSAEL